MLWVILTIIAYILFAGSSIVDRYLLAGPLKSPLVYVFYVGVTGILGAVLIPFGFFVPNAVFIGLAFAAAASAGLALYSLYHAMIRGSLSRVMPMVGALLPIFTLVLSLLFYDARLPGFLGGIALLFLIAATVLLSLDVVKGRLVPSRADIAHVTITAFLFALTFVLTKAVYDNITFINGFIWTRLASFLFALSLLLIPSIRTIVFKKNPIKKKNVYVPALLGKGSGALGFLFQQYAVSLASVGQLAFINALQGIQYVFIVLFVVALARLHPRFLREQIGKAALPFQISGLVFLLAGLYILFISLQAS